MTNLLTCDREQCLELESKLKNDCRQMTTNWEKEKKKNIIVNESLFQQAQFFFWLKPDCRVSFKVFIFVFIVNETIKNDLKDDHSWHCQSTQRYAEYTTRISSDSQAKINKIRRIFL